MRKIPLFGQSVPPTPLLSCVLPRSRPFPKIFYFLFLFFCKNSLLTPKKYFSLFPPNFAQLYLRLGSRRFTTCRVSFCFSAFIFPTRRRNIILWRLHVRAVFEPYTRLFLAFSSQEPPCILFHYTPPSPGYARSFHAKLRGTSCLRRYVALAWFLSFRPSFCQL